MTDPSTAPRRIYLALDDHTDYLWSADEETYRQAFLEMLDYYLAQAEATDDEPADFQSRFCCDGSFWAWIYQHNRPAADFARLMARVRSGHITLPLNPLILTYGGAPLEAVLRGMYFGGALERRYGLRLPLAVVMENQANPYGLGALLAGSGVKYTWKGICQCASRIADAWDRPHDIYWWQGQDGSRVLMKWNSMLDNNKNLGGYAEGRDPAASLALVEGNREFQRRYPYAITGIFGKGWDDLKTLTQEFVSFARQNSTPARRVIVSNEVDFFEAFEAAYGEQLPVEASAYGNEWELYTASLAEVFGSARRAIEQLRAAEALAVASGLADPLARVDDPPAECDQRWLDLGLLYEHDLTADGPISREARAAFHRQKAAGIVAYSGDLLARGLAGLGSQIRRSGTAARFFAFNPLSWARSGAVLLPYDGEGPCHVVDLLSGEETPAQPVVQAGQRWLQVLAQAVPAVGYKVFEVRPGAGADFGPAGRWQDNTLENEFMRVRLGANGAVESWRVLGEGGRELVRASDGRALNDLGAPEAVLRLEQCGPVSLTVVAEASLPVAHTRRYTLLRGQPGLWISNEINENFGETLAWTFPFNLEAPDTWHEETGAIIRARLLEDGGQYASRCARYDWLTLNHFVDMSAAGGAGVTLANADCAFMQLGRSSVEHLDVHTPQVRVLAGGQVDGPNLGIPNQGGDQHFLQRFALRPHRGYDGLAAMRFALEHSNPLVSGPVTGEPQASGPRSERGEALLELDHPGVLLWALKPAEDGWQAGLVVRLWNLSGAPADFDLRIASREIRQAQVITHVETPLRAAVVQNGALHEHLAAHQLGSFLLSI